MIWCVPKVRMKKVLIPCTMELRNNYERNEEHARANQVALYRHYNTNLRQSAIVLEEYVPENHVVRLIDTVVEGMDTDLFLSHCKAMERLLHEHLPLMWLTAFECPDANTINHFRVGPNLRKLVKKTSSNLVHRLKKKEHKEKGGRLSDLFRKSSSLRSV